MKNSNRKNIARIVAIVLVALMVLGMLSVAFSASAANGEPQKLPKQEIFFKSRTFASNTSYEIVEGGILLVEKGATLTIYGSLVVNGTLKNEGTIVITGEIVDKREADTTIGYISNNGVIENRGTIRVVNGNINNNARAKFYNIGKLLLQNKQESGAQFYNMYRPRGEYTDYALLENTGEIIIEEGNGVGLKNYGNATVDNQGTITTQVKEQVTGTIKGNPVIVTSKEK